VQQNSFETIVAKEDAHVRLDVYLAGHIKDATRSHLKKLIKDGDVSVNGGVCTRPSHNLNPGDSVAVTLPPPPSAELTPEDIPLQILHQDKHLVVVNKPSGLVVHPAPGHATGTLVHAILHHCPDFQRPGDDPDRPGIVHRLDRFTSGALVVAKTPAAFAHLAKQAREHAFDRRYLALVRGEFKEDTGRIEAPVGRSTTDRARMSVTGVKSRDAVTRFKVLERFGPASFLALYPETGRTHQIRVHLRFAGRPVLGDPAYGVTDYGDLKVSHDVRKALEALQGQALHAEQLGLEHPATGKYMTFTAPAPPDFQAALDALRAWVPAP
jgi:23S rRNA pseudouridine1911/1915/1917 synthase